MLDKLFDYATTESKILEFWEEIGVYCYNSADISESFCIDTPPPTVSGSLHMGHVFSYVQADFVARYQRLKGRNVFYPIGFDDNGLPTERLVEKTFGIKVGVAYSEEALQLIRKYIPNFIPQDRVCITLDFTRICAIFVIDAEKHFEKLFKTLSLSVDWGLKYQTISQTTQNVAHASFLDLYNKGLIYQRNSPVYWDCADKTALAQADIEDKTMDSEQIFLKFILENGTPIEIMTTRPEMLCSCLAVLFNPNDARYKSLISTKVKVPYFGNLVPLIADETVLIDKGTGLVMCCSYGDWTDVEWIKTHRLEPRIHLGDDGKILHEYARYTKPNGTEDYLKIPEARAKIIKILEDNGDVVNKIKFSHAVKCAERSGKPIEILPKPQWYIALMPFKNRLLEIAKKVDFYPAHLRNRLEQWIEGLNQDWCISRDRFFGIPIPAKVLCQVGNDIPVSHHGYVGSDEELFTKEASIIADATDKYDDTRYFLKQIDGVLDTWFTSSLTPQIATNMFFRTDVNIDDVDLHQSLIPFSIRPQAHEIIRTWAFYTLAKNFLHGLRIHPRHIEKLLADKSGSHKSNIDELAKQPISLQEAKFVEEKFRMEFTEVAVYIRGCIMDGSEIDMNDMFYTPIDISKVEKDKPWKGVMLSGWCLANDKTKMSKSKGNVVTPIDLLEKHGTDVVRLWCSNSSLGADVAFNEQHFDTGRKLVTKLWNCAKFLELKLSILDLHNAEISNGFDVWIVDRLQKTIASYSKYFETMEYSKAKMTLDDFFWNDLCDNYIEIIKVRYYGVEANIYQDVELTKEQKDSIISGQQSCLLALYNVIKAVVQLYGVFAPYITEEIYQKLFVKQCDFKSVHARGNFPVVNTINADDTLLNACEVGIKVLAEVRKYKSDNNISLNAEVEKFKVSTEDFCIVKPIIEDLINATKIKHFIENATE